MSRLCALILLLASQAGIGQAEVRVDAGQLESLPVPVTNNAVASVHTAGRDFVISFNGLASGKTHSDTHANTYVFDSSTGGWSEAPSVPGKVGRLAAAAASVGQLAYVFGGYSVAADGSEVSTPFVHAFDPVSGRYSELAAMPVPVDDAIAVTFDNRFIYLISGWHDLANVNLTQRYDTHTDTWTQATPIPGPPVFGHAGGIVGNRIVYCDGVGIRAHPDKARDYVASDQCFMGIVDADNSRRIDWRNIEPHPGATRYRAAAAGVSLINAVLFVGGTDNPYNYNGIGYDGKPSEPMRNAVMFDVTTLRWQTLRLNNEPTMDHRALVPYGDRWLTVGGMAAGQAVTSDVQSYKLTRTD